MVGDADIVQNRLDVMGLRFAVHMGDVAHMHDDVGREHLLEGGAKGGNERGRQVRDEAGRVGKIAEPPWGV